MATESRRQRQRAELIAEAQELALAQVAEGGTNALSLSRIARQLGISPPSLYHYFPSREALLFSIVMDATEKFCDVQESAYRRSIDEPAPTRFRAIADDARQWCLQHPSLFQLIFGSGADLSEDHSVAIERASRRGLACIIASAAAIGDPSAELGDTAAQVMARQLADSWDIDEPVIYGLPPEGLLRGYQVSTYLVGLVTVELSSCIARRGVDHEAIWRFEISEVIRRLQRPN